MRKTVVWILILCLIASLIPIASADSGAKVQVGNTRGELLQVQVNYDGYLHSASVLRTEDGMIFAPLEWMTYYGLLKCKEENGGLEYYKPGQEKLRDYAKRWFILPQTGDYMVSWYFENATYASFLLHADDFSMDERMQLLLMPDGPQAQEIMDRYFSQTKTAVKRVGTNYMPIHKGTFTEVIPYADDYWVPLSELLALLELSAGVSNDGRILCISPSQVNLFDVLYEHGSEIKKLLFDSEKVVGNDFMAVTGWLFATLTGELYNVIPARGREIDYKEIFTNYLKDNEVYLSSFNSESDSKATYYKEVSENFKDIKTILGISAEGLEPLYEMLLKSVTDPEFYKKFFEPAEKAGKVIDVAASAMTYIEAFANQVEDHRLMLDAVYDYEAEKHWPSYVAAKVIKKTYESKANLAVAGTIDMTRKLLVDYAYEKLYKKALGGWYYAIELTKIICKDEYEYIVNSSKINLVGGTVQYAYSIFKDRFHERQFKEAGMNNIRLCLMMSLVGSRHAYTTYYTGDIVKDKIDKVDEILSKLYLAGTNREENTINICKLRLEQYRGDLPKLQLIKNDPVNIAEVSLLLQALGNGESNCERWVVQDVDRDTQEEISLLTDHGSSHALIEIDINHDRVSAEDASLSDLIDFGMPEIIPQEQMVYGKASDYLSALDKHFSKRSGVLRTIACDLNEDGTEDRIYVFKDAAEYWDRDNAYKLDLEENTLTLLVAEAREEGVMLRFCFDADFKGNFDAECTYLNGELRIDGYAYSYQDTVGAPFQKIGLVGMQSLYSYLSGEIKPWEQKRVEISYPNDSNRNKMDLIIDGAQLYVYAEMNGKDCKYYEIQTYYNDSKPIPIIGSVTTHSTAEQILKALSLAAWDTHEIVPSAEYLNVVQGPYQYQGYYECAALWALPDGEIYQVKMGLYDNTLDIIPYCVHITNLNKPKAAIWELMMQTPEEVASMLSVYSEWMSSDGETIYGEGYIGDAYVEVRFKLYDGTFLAEGIDVMFGNDVITVVPGLDSSASAQEAKDFLQPKMDWELYRSESDGDRDLYYNTNFYYYETTETFWYATVITAYTWTGDEGYGEGAFAGLELSYSAEKDEYDWYWALYG